jgi:rod shape-determining protein MreC
LLQVLSVYFIVQYSKYHHAAFGNSFNHFTGIVNSKYANVQQYFHLKDINDSLLKANEALYNKLKENYHLPDTSSKLVVDSIRVDSILKFKKYTYLSASVVSNSVNEVNNYIVLSRGKKGSLREGMGVVDVNGAVVGIITELNDDYAIVMSVLHKDSHISGKLMKGGETGSLSWDGIEPNMVTLMNIPKSAKVSKGDTVITSGFSTTFPKGLSIGIVKDVLLEKSSNNYKLQLRTSTNFYNLEYVYVLDNAYQEGVSEVLKKVKKEN